MQRLHTERTSAGNPRNSVDSNEKEEIPPTQQNIIATTSSDKQKVKFCGNGNSDKRKENIDFYLEIRKMFFGALSKSAL